MKPGRKRKLVDEVRGEWQVSIRKACEALEFDRSTYHYKSRRSGQAALEHRIKEICHARVRYGYRRVHVLLHREGWRHGQNKTRRIYHELGLQLRNKSPKRRVKAKLRDDRRPATRSNETWAMDFVHDQLATGHKLRVLTIVDTFSRFSPALQPRFTFRGTDVVAVLEGFAMKWDSRRRSASIRAASSCRAILTSGPTSAASRSTSRGLASRHGCCRQALCRRSLAASGSRLCPPPGREPHVLLLGGFHA